VVQRAGFFTFNNAPSNLATVLPAGQGEPSGVEPGAAQPARRDYRVNFARTSDWTIDVRARMRLAGHAGACVRPDGQPRHSLGRRSNQASP
jgi:hypothetical protein